MFSGGIVREHWLHFLMSLKENIGSKLFDWKRYIFQHNSNYTINWKFFLPYDLLQETIWTRLLEKKENKIFTNIRII